FWSSDNTSSGGSEPATAVSVVVSEGLFTIRLGDTTVANMMALGAGLFAQPDLQLRIWFSDGVSGFVALDPPQPLTAAPYAIFAANLSGTVAASQLTGLISSNNIGAGSITRTMLAAGSVGSSQLAPGAVTSAAIANGAVGANQLAAGAVTTVALSEG